MLEGYKQFPRPQASITMTKIRAKKWDSLRLNLDVDPVGGTTGTGFLIGNATAPTS
jgi:hypothetical protein